MADQCRLSRRSFAVAAGATVVIGFEPNRRSWVREAEANGGIAIPVPHLDGTLTTDPNDLAEAAQDYGYIISRTPRAVLLPGSARDVATIIRYARQIGVKVAPRGLSHSVFGQAQVDAGIVIDMKPLDRIYTVRRRSVWVDAGVRWKDVVDAAFARGVTPRVLTDYIELTVGGVLSVGGVGGASAQFGVVAENVLALEVITGKGQRVYCSRRRNRDLFEGVLGGLGQFAIITKAQIRLQPAQTTARIYQLTYFSAANLIRDQRIALRDDRFDYLEGQFAFAEGPSGPQLGFLLEGAIYYSNDPPNDKEALKDLTPDLSPPGGATDLPLVAWLNRLAEFEAGLRQAGLWETPHPWSDIFMPDTDIESFITEQTASLTPSDLGAGLGLIYPFRPAKFAPSSMVYPDEPGLVWLFDILRIPTPDPATGEFDEALVDNQLSDNRARYEAARDAGGKRYPISAVEFSETDWQTHYGANFATVRRRKRQYDPGNILTPGQGIFAA